MITQATAITQRTTEPAAGPDRQEKARWEWRAFDRTISVPDAPDLKIVFRETPLPASWLLSPCSSFDVRVRDTEMEIRRLERIDRRNLELWHVIHRYHFPLHANAVAAVCVNLGVSEPGVDAPVDRDEFLAQMASAAPDVIVAPVRATSVAFRLAECSGEHLKIRVGDQRWESLALFSHEPGPVHAALQRLGLSTVANTNWPAALKLMLGLADRPAIR